MIYLVEILMILLEKQLLIQVLSDIAFNIAQNYKYEGYQWRPSSLVYSVLIKRFQAVLLKKVMPN